MLHAGHDRAETQGDDLVHDHSRPDHNTRHEQLLGGVMEDVMMAIAEHVVVT